MIAESDPADSGVASQIYAVAQAAYALEAKWIGSVDFPPLRESQDDLRRSTDTFLVFNLRAKLVGILSFDPSTDPIVVTRLVVCPSHLRRGIATALLVDLERRLP